MKLILHSGGAKGADLTFDRIGFELGILKDARHYWHGRCTPGGNVEQSDEDFKEGCLKVKEAASKLKRYGYMKYMDLLARNWNQVKYSDAIYAVSRIKDFKEVDGGTGWACQMAIDAGKPLYVFNLNDNKWYMWSTMRNLFTIYHRVLAGYTNIPVIKTKNFAGIGTRNLPPEGENAIRELYKLYISESTPRQG